MEGQYTALDANLEPLVSDAVTEKDGEEGKGAYIAQLATVQKKSRKSQCLYFLLVIFAIIAISASIATICLAIILGVRSSMSQPQTASSDSNMCLTPSCVQLAAQVTAAMNQSIDPCDDFYQFSCGNWEKNNMIPQGGQVQNQFSELQITIFQKLGKIIESGNDGGVEAVRKVIDLYQSCMDAATVDSLGATPLLDLIETLGGWSLIGIPETSSWSINNSSFFYEKAHGSTAFFNFVPFFNAVTMSRSKYALHFAQQPTTFTGSSQSTTAIKALGITILTLLNASVDQSTYSEAVQGILDFDMELSKILVPPSKVPSIENGDAVPLLNQSNIYTFERLQILWPEFDWQTFITYMYGLSGLDVPQNLEIVVTTPDYFQRLDALLQNTSQDVIHNYAKIFFVLNYLGSLSSQFASFRSATDPKPGDLVTCISFVQKVLPIALARPYVEQFVQEGTKENVSMILDYLRQDFRERVSEMDWLSDLSKQRSIEKVDAITSQIAYPAEIFDNDYVNGLYTTFTAIPSDYFGNRLRANELLLHLRLNLTYGYDKMQWPTDPAFMTYPTFVNAFYSRHVNQMYVMAAIAGDPIFRADWPEYFSFGGFGTFVGHEITHGFDNNGQLFDKDGVRRMWWSTKSQTEFQNRLQCFIDQYNQYTVGGITVNGMGTLPENIADNGGLHASFRAHRMRIARNPQKTLPALPYTPDQLFFIAYGQTWCELALPSYYQQKRDTDPHAPSPARVYAVVNVQEFAEAFKCPVGSPMNPANKCLLW